jgi:branched-chain amino acid transport system substrate-binding protein
LPLKDEVPEGWIVTGYPWDEIKEPKHKAFIDAYRAKFNDTPRLGSLLGYMVVYMLRDTIERAGSVETDALVKAMEDAKFDTVIGPVTMRGIDNQSTMGAWVGKLTLKGANGGMTDWTYRDGASFMPTEAEVKAVRKD